MTDAKLLPCPFCGGEIETHVALELPDNSLSPLLFCCHHCGAMVSFNNKLANVGRMHGDDSPTIKLWNTRYERTCHMVFDNPRSHKCRCDRCGFNYLIGDDVAWHGDRFIYLWDYCKGCGAKVVDDD